MTTEITLPFYLIQDIIRVLINDIEISNNEKLNLSLVSNKFFNTISNIMNSSIKTPVHIDNINSINNKYSLLNISNVKLVKHIIKDSENIDFSIYKEFKSLNKLIIDIQTVGNVNLNQISKLAKSSSESLEFITINIYSYNNIKEFKEFNILLKENDKFKLHFNFYSLIYEEDEDFIQKLTESVQYYYIINRFSLSVSKLGVSFFYRRFSDSIYNLLSNLTSISIIEIDGYNPSSIYYFTRNNYDLKNIENLEFNFKSYQFSIKSLLNSFQSAINLKSVTFIIDYSEDYYEFSILLSSIFTILSDSTSTENYNGNIYDTKFSTVSKVLFIITKNSNLKKSDIEMSYLGSFKQKQQEEQIEEQIEEQEEQIEEQEDSTTIWEFERINIERNEEFYNSNYFYGSHYELV